MQKKIEKACRDGASASRLSAIEQHHNLHDSSVTTTHARRRENASATWRAASPPWPPRSCTPARRWTSSSTRWVATGSCDAQHDRIRRSQERQRACLALAGATPTDDAPPPAVVASSELPRRPISPQSAAHYLRRADAAKPAARKWTP